MPICGMCIPGAEVLVNEDGEEKEDAAEDGEELEEEAEPKRLAPSPTLPSAAEIEDHRTTHFPYRSWCPHCVAGRALGERRGAQPLDWQYKRHLISIVSMDYFYLTSGGVKTQRQ